MGPWGEASRGRNDDLICSGRNEMEVELDFLSNGQLYKVIRKYSRSSPARPGQSMLDLQVHRDGLYSQVTEHGKRETQEKINDLLHLNYSTFINSAMLLQGRSNEFSRKRPGERKEILAGILDLSFYDDLEQEARRRADLHKSEATALQREISSLKARLEEQPNLETNVSRTLEELRVISQSLERAKNQLSELRQLKESLLAKQDQLNLINRQTAERMNTLEQKRKRGMEIAGTISRLTKILHNQAAIEEGYEKYRMAMSQEGEYNEKLKQYTLLSDRKNRLITLVNAAQTAYSSELKLLSARISDLSNRHARLPQLQSSRVALLKSQQQQREMETRLEQLKIRRDNLIHDAHSCNLRATQIDAAVRDLREKIEMMSHAGASCPLCESELGPEGCSKLRGKLSSELNEQEANMLDNSNQLAAINTEISTIEKNVAALAASIKANHDKTTSQLAVTEKELAEIASTAVELSQKIEAAAKLSEVLKLKDYARDQQGEIHSIDAEFKLLGYDRSTHARITQEKTDLARFETLHLEAAEARARLATEESASAEITGEIALLVKQCEELSVLGREVQRELLRLPEVISQLERAETHQRQLSEKEGQIRVLIAELTGKINHLAEIAGEQAAKKERLDVCLESESVYAELSRCFGKKGIQVLIIEESIPEIEHEANVLLGKMTENRMSLSLETQRDTRKGSIVETLDIKISDELGTRDYEMFSGGEAYRIDLALRIAISRLLVRRAGAAMPILIIDEGFGTQDAAGLEKLVETINAIQDDFEKVFVITHIDELKDRFPVLITVTKSSEGSLISLNQ